MTLPLLQMPGAPELIIILLIFVVGLVILVGATYWVYNDAQSRGNDNAALWAVLTALGFFIGLVPGLLVIVIYLVVGRE
ncbi:hypothetical protein KTS45_01305 [Halomicroarcula limicola]|uniref:Cardiolipin synthase N-terminal domain-containing protein n=1 Tax=Haloarcula limicola TaxID=1429915 RepID=A0A8J8C1U9_9EURY|nr:hypothetical protein [Halomicroarcula limicola]MBV0922826.1 hypothetical protein [Halomicroarcula limicola]